MRYTLESMDPYLSGDKEWPVIKEMAAPFPDCLAGLIGAGVEATRVRWLRNSDGKRLQCRYFMLTTQGGSYTGKAFALYSHWHQGHSKVRMVTVAMCDHKVESTSTRDERMHGWHKSHCTECGLDMSVDSSG